MGEEGHEGVLLRRNQPLPISTSLTLWRGLSCGIPDIDRSSYIAHESSSQTVQTQ